jgi:hypothetical protein
MRPALVQHVALLLLSTVLELLMPVQLRGAAQTGVCISTRKARKHASCALEERGIRTPPVVVPGEHKHAMHAMDAM